MFLLNISFTVYTGDSSSQTVRNSPLGQLPLAVLSEQGTLYRAHYTVHSIQCTVYCAHYTVHSIQCTVYSEPFTVYSVRCKV